MDTKKRIARVEGLLKDYPDFPRPGILFRDIWPVTQNPEVFSDLIDLMVEHIQSLNKKVDVVVGLESRGFIFGPMIAERLKVSFVPIRKKGKLPGDCVSTTYDLEYGKDTMEVQRSAISEGKTVVIVDDLLATGGTMSAAVKLLRQLNVNIVEGLVVIELNDLKGRDKVSVPVHSLIAQ